MKLMYKIMLFMIAFQFTILILNATNVFPEDGQFYSDTDIDVNVRDSDTAIDSFGYIFVPDGNHLGLTADDNGMITISAVITVFLAVGAIGAWVTHSFVPVVVVFMGYMFFVMITRSMSFFQKLFTNWDNQIMLYLSICLGVAIFFIVLITIVETPTHGRSG